jgi:hypothetical protein
MARSSKAVRRSASVRAAFGIEYERRAGFSASRFAWAA